MTPIERLLGAAAQLKQTAAASRENTTIRAIGEAETEIRAVAISLQRAAEGAMARLKTRGIGR